MNAGRSGRVLQGQQRSRKITLIRVGTREDSKCVVSHGRLRGLFSLFFRGGRLLNQLKSVLKASECNRAAPVCAGSYEVPVYIKENSAKEIAVDTARLTGGHPVRTFVQGCDMPA